MFGDIAQNGQDSVSIIDLITGSLADLIRYTGDFISISEKVVNSPWFAGGLWTSLLHHFEDVTGGSKDLGGVTDTLASQMTSAQKAANGEQDALAGLASEIKAETDPVFAFTKAQTDLAAAQKEANSALKDHGKNSPEFRDAVDKETTAAENLTTAAGQLGDKFDGKLSPALVATLQAAGLTKTQISALAGQFKSTQTAGNNFAKKYQAAAVVNGVVKAQDQLIDLVTAAQEFAGRYTATMIVNYVQTGKPSSVESQQFPHGLAHGGVSPGGAASGKATSGALTWVGEQGPELVSLPGGSTVYSANQSANMAGGGAGPITVTLVFPTSDNEVMSAITRGMRIDVKNTAGGSVQRHLGVAGVAA